MQMSVENLNTCLQNGLCYLMISSDTVVKLVLIETLHVVNVVIAQNRETVLLTFHMKCYMRLMLVACRIQDSGAYNAPCGLWVVRIDPFHFLVGCYKRGLNQALLSILSLSLGFFLMYVYLCMYVC